MKRVILLMVFMATTLLCFAQPEGNNAEKRMKYSFSIRINYGNLLHDNSLPDNAIISNKAGFRLGILEEYRISKNLFISPKAELSFLFSPLAKNKRWKP